MSEDHRKSSNEVTSGSIPPLPRAQREEVYAELGRCLLVYQSIEKILKLYLPHIRASKSEAQKLKEIDWRELIDSKKTLGYLITFLLERTEAKPRVPFEQGLRLLVDQRNEVIHHFDERTFASLATDIECQEALEYLVARRNYAKKWLRIFSAEAAQVFEIDTIPSQRH